MTEINEEWCPIAGYEDRYAVSNLGRVKSLQFKGKSREKILKPIRAHGGHLQVNLYPPRPDGTKLWFVHRLVLQAFISPCPPDHECRHLNGNPADNRVSNLAWGTKRQNMQDTLRHGRHWQQLKTHCPRGHAYDKTYNRKRFCTACQRDYAREWREEQKQRKRDTWEKYGLTTQV